MSESSPVTPTAAGPPSAAASAAGDAPIPTDITPPGRRRPEAVDVAVWLFLAAISYIP